MIAVNRSQRWEYQLKDDRRADGSYDPSNTVFDLRRLTPAEEADVNDGLTQFQFDKTDPKAMSYEGARVSLNRRNVRACELGVVGWKRMKNTAGAAVEFVGDGTRASQTSLGMIPSRYLNELATEILGASELTPEEKD